MGVPDPDLGGLSDVLRWTPGPLLVASALAALVLAALLAATCHLVSCRLRGGRRTPPAWLPGFILLAAGFLLWSGPESLLPFPWRAIESTGAHPALPGLVLTLAGAAWMAGARFARIVPPRGRAALFSALVAAAGLAGAGAARTAEPDADSARARTALRAHLERGRGLGEVEELYLVLAELPEDEAGRFLALEAFLAEPRLATRTLGQRGRLDDLASLAASADTGELRVESALELAKAGDGRALPALLAAWGPHGPDFGPAACELAAALARLGRPEADAWIASRLKERRGAPPPSLGPEERRILARIEERELALLASKLDEFGAPRPVGLSPTRPHLEDSAGFVEGAAGDPYRAFLARDVRPVAEDREHARLLVLSGAVPPDEVLAQDLADPRGSAFPLAAWCAIFARRKALRDRFTRHLDSSYRPLVALGVLALREDR
ncbi:MAG: hypothetical protein HY720_25280 [Planctomycetes bacterium]|nr:hypothetical protein [Planctomycetota bacterium]